MNRSCFFTAIFAVAVLCQGTLVSAAKVIINAADAQIPALIKTTSDQVTYTHDPNTPKFGINVNVQPGADRYPTITFNPKESAHWDFSGYSNVQAKVTNTSKQQLLLCMRVDNPHKWAKSPWNTECLRIQAGQSKTVKVLFGHSYGFNPSYPLKPKNVVAILLTAGKSDVPQSFRIEIISVDGAAGEKSVKSLANQRIQPKGGIIFGQGVSLDMNKQIKAVGGAKVAMNQSALTVDLPATATRPAVILSPTAGYWHLGDATQVAVMIRNTGQSTITPSIALTSWGQLHQDIVGQPIKPGDQKEVVVSFAQKKPWEGVPADKIQSTHESKPGTGTHLASDKVGAIRISFIHKSVGNATIKSVIARASIAVVPDWVGKRPPVDGDWVVTFDDDFNSSSVDLSKWRNEGPNYWDKVSRWSKNNAIIADGIMRLHYEKKAGYHNDNPKQAYKEYTGGYLDTFTKWSQCYGYFEARMKLPTTPGLWPAFWMMPDRGVEANLPSGSMAKRCTTSNKGMEFDIMEYLAIWGPHRYNIAMHWDDYGPKHKAIGTGKIYVNHDKDGYITSGLLWLPGLAVYYCNGVEIGRWEDPRISSVPSYMMFSMPAGGWDGNHMDDSKLPDDFTIDYVRVWQRKDLMAQ